MRVLITNDDGFQAVGIHALAEAVNALKWEAVIIAPYSHMSGASRGRISNVDLPWKKVAPILGYDTYWVDGSPASCVVFGLTSGMFSKFDLCISGINAGENLGAGLTISGTFGAALEAISYGIKAIALSRENDKNSRDPNLWDWSFTRECATKTLEYIMTLNESWQLANVNIPNCERSPIKFMHTQISKESYFFDKYMTNDNKIYSTIGFDKKRLENHDDIFALRMKKVVGISLLKGEIV